MTVPYDYDQTNIDHLRAVIAEQEQTINDLHECCKAGEAENAKLREDLEDQEGYDQMLRDRLRQQTELCVKAETKNEKLRELLAEIYPYAKAYLQEWLVVGGIDSKSYDWYLRLRELGVEVTDE